MPLGEEITLSAHDFDPDQPLTETQCGLQGVRQAADDVLFDNKAVNDHLDGVFLVLFQNDLVTQLAHFTIDTHPDETVRLQLT